MKIDLITGWSNKNVDIHREIELPFVPRQHDCFDILDYFNEDEFPDECYDELLLFEVDFIVISTNNIRVYLKALDTSTITLGEKRKQKR